MKLPKAKNENIVVRDLRDELLVYNLATHQAFALNRTLKIIFESCDGQRSSDDLKRSFKFTDDLIYLALDELRRCDLLENFTYQHYAGLSRREAIKKVGLTSLVALPVVTALVAPKAIEAQSQSCIADGGACNFDSSYTQGQCCSGSRCFNTGRCQACIASQQQYYTCPGSGCCSGAGARGNCCNTTSTPTETPSVYGFPFFDCFCP